MRAVQIVEIEWYQQNNVNDFLMVTSFDFAKQQQE